MENDKSKEIMAKDQVEDELELDIDLDDLEMELGDYELDDAPEGSVALGGAEISGQLDDLVDDLFADMDDQAGAPVVLEDDHNGLAPEHLEPVPELELDLELDEDDIIYTPDPEETIVLTGDEVDDILAAVDEAESNDAEDVLDLGMLIVDEADLGAMAGEEEEDISWENALELEDEPDNVIPMDTSPIVVDDQPVWLEPRKDDKEVFTTTIVRNTRTGLYHLKTNGEYSSNSWDTFNGAMGALYSDLLSYMEPYKRRLEVV